MGLRDAEKASKNRNLAQGELAAATFHKKSGDTMATTVWMHQRATILSDYLHVLNELSATRVFRRRPALQKWRRIGFRVLMTYGTNAIVLDKTCVIRNLQEAIRRRLARTCPRAATGATRGKRRRNLAFKTYVFCVHFVCFACLRRR